MVIYTISGKAGAGKDFFAKIAKEQLQRHGKSVLITHYADLLKFICMYFLNWDGGKGPIGRQTLQYIGTDVIRQYDPDYFVNFLISILTVFNDMWDVVLIPDARFPNEIDKMKERFKTKAILIKRDFESSLTSDALMHVSENALVNYYFDLILDNMSQAELREIALSLV